MFEHAQNPHLVGGRHPLLLAEIVYWDLFDDDLKVVCLAADEEHFTVNVCVCVCNKIVYKQGTTIHKDIIKRVSV